MNRRDLIRRGPMALLGIGAAASGVEVQPEQSKQTLTIVLRPDAESEFRARVVKSVMENVKADGQIRELILNQ